MAKRWAEVTARAERPSEADEWRDIARQLYVALSNRECRCIKVMSKGPALKPGQVINQHQCMRCAAMARYELEGAKIPTSND